MNQSPLVYINPTGLNSYKMKNGDSKKKTHLKSFVQLSSLKKPKKKKTILKTILNKQKHTQTQLTFNLQIIYNQYLKKKKAERKHCMRFRKTKKKNTFCGIST